MRLINEHKATASNMIDVVVVDEPGVGGACHEYDVTIPESPGGRVIRISFQNGPLSESGFNGLTQEVLIAICIDRLRGFQSGQYACRENALALTKLEEAQHWLHHRTLARMQRGVEGTHEK